MNHIHEGIRCDVCNEQPIVGVRYVCLVCYDYDLCEKCFSCKRSSLNHKPYHPIQPMLPRDEFSASLLGISSPAEQLRVYCCPYCGDRELSGLGLIRHCRQYHSSGGGHGVRCPVCLLAGQRQHYLLTDPPLVEHLSSQHGEFLTGHDSATEVVECAICMENLSVTGADVKYLRCGHSFHNACIMSWINTNPNCPICRAQLDLCNPS